MTVANAKGVGLLPLPPGEGRGEGTTCRTPPVAFARNLRRQQTPAEAVLWRALRNWALTGAKFRRQVPYGPYTLDFASNGHRLVIELDGDAHATGAGQARDARRDAWLKSDGWHVMRFTNADVLGNLDGVLQAVTTGMSFLHPGPLPEGEGEAASPHPVGVP